MGIFSRKKKTGKGEQAFGFVGDTGQPEAMSMEEAAALREQLLSQLAAGDRDSAINAASGLMASKQYDAAANAFETIAEQAPDMAAVCASQVGAARYFLGQYEAALDQYVRARDLGLDADMMDDNIWEACEALHGASGDPRWGARYLELCPEGSYVKKARKLR